MKMIDKYGKKKFKFYPLNKTKIVGLLAFSLLIISSFSGFVLSDLCVTSSSTDKSESSGDVVIGIANNEGWSEIWKTPRKEFDEDKFRSNEILVGVKKIMRNGKYSFPENIDVIIEENEGTIMEIIDISKKSAMVVVNVAEGTASDFINGITQYDVIRYASLNLKFHECSVPSDPHYPKVSHLNKD